MKFLLDEMHAPRVAERLRSSGHDVVAVKERPEWIGLPDDELLAVAAQEQRVLVTENVKDFAALDRAWAAAERRHAGLVFTHPRRFPRFGPKYVERLVACLARFVESDSRGLHGVESFVWWLDSPRTE